MREKQKVERSVLWHRLSRVIKWVPMVFAAVLLISFALGQVPKIQTGIINEITSLISKNTSFRLKVGHANLTWYDEMLLRDIRLYHKDSDSTMISAKEMKVDFSLIGYVFNREIIGDRLTLEKPFVHIIKESDSTYVNINLFVTELKQLFKKSPKKKTSISIKQIFIKDGIFSFNILKAPPAIRGKDFSHFSYDLMNAKFSGFLFKNDSIGFKVDSLSARDPEFFLPIHKMASIFSFTSKEMVFEELDLEIGKSSISKGIKLTYSKPGDLKYFTDSVRFVLDMQNTLVSKADLGIMGIESEKIKSDLQVSGVLSGSFKRLNTQNLDFRFGSGSQIKGSGYFYGLPAIDETFIDFAFSGTQIISSDLSPYLNKRIDEKISKLGNVTLDGSFVGFRKDFVSKGFLNTNIGNLDCDINMKIGQNNRASYNGDIILKDFKTNILFPELVGVESVTMNGHIKGLGLDAKNANIDIDADIDSLEYKGIRITNIQTSGHFERAFLDASFEIQDPNLRFNGVAELDVRNNQNKFRIKANVDTLNLKALGLTPRPFTMSSEVDINMKGLRADEMRGFVNLNKTQLASNNKKLYIDSLRFLSSQIGTDRLIHLETDGFSCEVKGKYSNKTLVSGITKLVRELLLNIKNEKDSIDLYYSQSNTFEPESLNAELSIRAKDLNRFVSPFVPEFSISKNISVKGRIKQDSIVDFYLYTNIDSLRFGEKLFRNSTLDVTLSKNYFDKEVLGAIYLKSENQNWNKNFKTESFHTEFIWQKDHIDIWSRIAQNNLENTFEVNSSIDFESDQTTLHMMPSDIRIFGNQWRWNPKNSLVIQGSDLTFNDFILSSGEESIEATGRYTLSNRESINVNIKEFNLANLQPLLPFRMDGTLNGVFKIKREVGPDKIDVGATARGVKMNDYLIGNVFIDSKWENSRGRIANSVDIVKNENKKLEMKGFYNINKPDSPLDFSLKLNDADLKLLTPILKNIFSNLDGSISGFSTISGSFKKPYFGGKYQVSGGTFRVNYLNTTYTMNGPVLLEDKNLRFDNFLLEDKEGHQAAINGNLEYLGSKRFAFDLIGSFEDFKLLNTNSTDNDLYYGLAYGTGEVHFSGTNEHLQIKSEARTSKGTRLSFPIDQLSDVDSEQKEYIQFVDLSKKEEEKDPAKKTEPEVREKIKGVVLDLDIEMTTDAYVEMIFDVKAGDIIRGRGNGNLDFLISTEGDFTMLGDYIIDNGGYNFTLYNIINKEFEIQKGSAISWYGDPYGAILNINADYRQLASLSPILTDLDEEDRNSAELRKKYPSIVKLNLSDDLLTPTIKFDIDIVDYPTSINVPSRGVYPLEDQVNAFKTKIKFNEQEMNRQVFSLVVLRKFSPENGFQVNSETIGSSLSEFVSNQLSYWATQVDENLEIDVDLASLDQDAFNTFQLRLSYTFLDGRLKVTRGGGLPNDQNRDDIYAILGDWTVEYLLTEDGRFRAKIYSRSDLNTISVEPGQNNIETGFSLQFVRSFDDLSQILSDSRDKNLKKSSTSTTN